VWSVSGNTDPPTLGATRSHGSPFGLNIWPPAGITGHRLRGVVVIRRRSRVTLRSGNPLHFPFLFRQRSASRLAGSSGRAIPPLPLPSWSLCSAILSRDARSPGSVIAPAGRSLVTSHFQRSVMETYSLWTCGISDHQFPSRLGILRPFLAGRTAPPFGSRVARPAPLRSSQVAPSLPLLIFPDPLHRLRHRPSGPLIDSGQPLLGRHCRPSGDAHPGSPDAQALPFPLHVQQPASTGIPLTLDGIDVHHVFRENRGYQLSPRVRGN
jgi:hypothetical protein